MLMPSRLFDRPALPLSAGHIIGWWESRRLYYNAILLATVILVALLAAVLPGMDEKPHLSNAWSMFLLGFFLLLLPANIWYTGGWLADLFIKKVLHFTALGFGPWALGAGIALSLVFMAFIYSLLFHVILHGVQGM